MTFKAKSLKRPIPIFRLFRGGKGSINIFFLCACEFFLKQIVKKKKADKNVFRNLTSEILELSRLIFN